MKKVFVLALAVLVSASALSQTTTTKKAKVDPKAGRKETSVAAHTPAAETRAPLTAEELEVATRVQVGNLPCELGQTVVLTPDTAAGFFSLRLGKETYRVAPEMTTTGAIRLEDKAAGVVWLQLANKSMLMSQKLGRRLADECRSPAQTLMAEKLLKNPPPNVFEALPPPVLSPVITPTSGVQPPASAAPAAN